jgi:hypothetical protein
MSLLIFWQRCGDMLISTEELDTGYWHIRGEGPCNWAQPPKWPCDEGTLRGHMFPEACEEFVRSAMTTLGEKDATTFD